MCGNFEVLFQSHISSHTYFLLSMTNPTLGVIVNLFICCTKLLKHDYFICTMLYNYEYISVYIVIMKTDCIIHNNLYYGLNYVHMENQDIHVLRR